MKLYTMSDLVMQCGELAERLLENKEHMNGLYAAFKKSEQYQELSEEEKRLKKEYKEKKELLLEMGREGKIAFYENHCAKKIK